MHKWRTRPLQVGCIRRSASAQRSFNSNSSYFRSDEKTINPLQFNNKKTSARASRDVQGLRRLAPGGFAPSPNKNNDRQQPIAKRIAAGVSRSKVAVAPINPTQGGVNDDITSIVRRTQPPRSSVVNGKTARSSMGVAYGEGEGGHVGKKPEEAERIEDEGDEGQSQLEFIEALEEHMRGPAVRFAPETFTPDDLITDRMSTAVGHLGALSQINEATGRLARRNDIRFGSDADLARQLMAGRLVKFRNIAEKIRVTSLAEGWAGETADKLQEKLGEPVKTEPIGFVPVGQDAKKELTDKVVRGYYEEPRTAKSNIARTKTADHLARSMLMNGTYTPSAGKSMQEHIERLWPQESQGPAPGK
jgi:hypothetical protein